MTVDKAYAILGVEAGTDPKQVQKAYRCRAMECHPDRAKAEDAEYYARKFMEIRDAYELLRKQGFPIPEPEKVVEEPAYYRRTADRSFTPKRKSPDAEQFEKMRMSTGLETHVGTYLLWAGILAAPVILFFFLKYLYR
ncbi:MAG: J domain-containing protein [Elusimicrobia bacterium]|nr:J domain-containing protein [Elusimicrobiota bacterium]